MESSFLSFFFSSFSFLFLLFGFDLDLPVGTYCYLGLLYIYMGQFTVRSLLFNYNSNKNIVCMFNQKNPTLSFWA